MSKFCDVYSVKTAEKWSDSPIPRYEDHDFWKSIDLGSRYIQHILDMADKERQQPTPVLTATSFMGFTRTGSRQPHSSLLHARRNRLAFFVIAACIRRDGSFTDALTDEIWAICEESSWIQPAHVRVHGDGQSEEALPSLKHDGFDLAVAMTAQGLAEALYMMESVIHPLVAERIRFELERRVFRPAREKEYKWFYYGSNWTAVCVGGTISAALYAEQDLNKLKQLLNKFTPFLLDNFINGFTADGGTSEGISCWTLGFKHYLYAADTLSYATDQQWSGFSSKQVKNICAFALNTYMGDGQYPTFSEPEERSKPFPWVINYISQVLKDDNYLALLNELEKHYEDSDVIRPDECHLFDMVRLICWWEVDKPSRKAVPEFKFKPYCYLPDLQWLTIPSQGGLQIAMKGGNNGEMHNHNDLGTIIVHSKHSEPFLADLARGAMTRAYFYKNNRYDSLEANSFGHNVPRINGRLQMTGKSSYAICKNPKLIENDLLQWQTDLSHAYEIDAGILKLERVLYADINTGQHFNIEDHFEFEENPGSFESVFYTYADQIKCSEGTVFLSFDRGSVLSLNFDDYMWHVEVENVNDELSRQRDYPVHRIIWKNKTLAKQGMFKLQGEFIAQR